MSYNGRSGRSVQTALNSQLEEACIREFKPDIVGLLQVGSNNLCSPSKSPQSVFMEIKELFNTLLFTYNVNRVVVFQILIRLPPTCRVRHRVNVPWFNERVAILNSLISNSFKGESKLFYWRHKGLNEHIKVVEALLTDGVHLNNLGYFKYFKNIRAAVVSIIKTIKE